MSYTSTEILFEKFEIIECLKKDIYSSVYLANHIYLGKKIILKTLNKEEMNEPAAIERFKREAKILAKLDDPNLINIIDFGTYDKYFYLSFEYFESRNLRSAMKERSFNDLEKKNIALQLLKGLDAANRKGIIHRDIKPENILLNKNNVLKIADFGLALTQNDLMITSKSSIVGTPGYMSPEQVRGDKLTHQTDLFSAGIVIYELFTGTNPFLGSDISETINNILNFKNPASLEHLQILPPEIKEVVISLLKPNVKERGNSAGEVLLISNLLTTGEFSSMVKKKKSKVMLMTVITLFLIITGMVIIFSTNGTKHINKVQSVVENKEDINTNGTNNPENTEPTKVEKIPIKADGRLNINVFPWAEVYIDNKLQDKTPLRNDLIIKPGQHTLKLVHPDYPEYKKSITIEPGQKLSVKFNFESVTGKFDCKVVPWGDIYLNGRKIATTPLIKLINLLPGEYEVKVVNSALNKIKEFKIKIKAGETTEHSINFEVENN